MFQRFQEARLYLNPEKCHPCPKEVQHLGHFVSPKVLTTYAEKLKAVFEWSTTKK
jgi:hypothetical protein